MFEGRWCFNTYISPNGRADVQLEIDEYDDYAREAFSRAVAHLAATPLDGWHDPYGKKLKGQDPLYEIKYKANKRATRAIGYFLKGSSTFVILIFCYHKQGRYYPHEAFESARRRLELITNGQARTTSLQIDGEDFPSHEGSTER